MRPTDPDAIAMKQTFISADDLLLDSFRLAARIVDSGFRPNFLVGLWRGGSAVGIAVQEGLHFLGTETDHIAVRTSYSGAPGYEEMVSGETGIRVHGLQYLLENLCSDHSLLIVDDVYSTGSSVRAVIDQLRVKTRRNLPQDIRTASVWYRPSERTIRAPDFYLHETRDWLVLPYELVGLSLDELQEHKPEIEPVLPRLEAWLARREETV